MAKNPDSNIARNPSGTRMRELHERVSQRRRAQGTGKQQNKLAQPQNRWQRAVRYNWDKKRG